MSTTETKPVYNIYFDPALDAVVMQWNGYANSSQFREGTELMLNELINNKTSKVLADIKNMVLIGSEDQKWLEEYFVPRAMKFGFKAVAFVRPDNYFNQIAVESVTYKIGTDKLKIEFFDARAEAEKWIASLVLF